MSSGNPKSAIPDEPPTAPVPGLDTEPSLPYSQCASKLVSIITTALGYKFVPRGGTHDASICCGSGKM